MKSPKGKGAFKRFENKVTIVTGEVSGIGRATAIKFSDLEAKVVLTDLGEMFVTIHENIMSTQKIKEKFF